jgi:hypothetical protein
MYKVACSIILFIWNQNPTECGLGMWLMDRVLAWHVWSPGFYPQHQIVCWYLVLLFVISAHSKEWACKSVNLMTIWDAMSGEKEQIVSKDKS